MRADRKTETADRGIFRSRDEKYKNQAHDRNSNIKLAQIFFVIFFFKQKTAYEIGVRLVGSEMCIRDSPGAKKIIEGAK